MVIKAFNYRAKSSGYRHFGGGGGEWSGWQVLREVAEGE